MPKTAVHEPAADVAGRYLHDCRVVAASPGSTDPAVAARLWTLSEEWVARGRVDA